MTRLLVLGLLDDGPLSGYHIQQKICRADAQRWGGVLVGSIYHALKKLEQEGYIALAEVSQTGHRQRAVYQITDQGRAYLPKLLLDALAAPSVQYPTTLYSGLSLLEKVPPEAARQALLRQQKALEEEERALEAGVAENRESSREVSRLSQITIANMFAILRQQQQMLAQLLEALEP